MTGALARIPFSAHDEGRIQGASNWMRFIAILQIVGTVIGLLMLVLLGTVFSLFSDQLKAALQEAASKEGAPADLDAILALPLGLIFLVVGAIALVSLAIQLWASLLLYRAADSFSQVVKTDEADQDFLADGFKNLRTFFYIEAVFAVLAAINATLGLLGMGGAS